MTTANWTVLETHALYMVYVLKPVIVIIAGCCINLCADQSVSSTAHLE